MDLPPETLVAPAIIVALVILVLVWWLRGKDNAKIKLKLGEWFDALIDTGKSPTQKTPSNQAKSTGDGTPNNLPPDKPPNEKAQDHTEDSTAPFPLLRLRLTVQGDHLLRRYAIPDPPQVPSSDWPALKPVLANWTRHGSGALQQPGFGEALYQALFGPPALGHGLTIVQRLSDTKVSSPLHQPLKVLIETNDPLLAQLPWPQARFGHEPVSQRGWNLAVGRDLDQPLADLACHLPGHIQLYIPTRGDPESERLADLHFATMDACLHSLWPLLPPRHDGRLRDWPPAAANRNRPWLLYVDACAAVSRNRLHLVNGDGQPLAVKELLTAAPETRVLFLNLEMASTLDFSPAAELVGLLGGPCQLLMVQRYTAGQRADARERARRWLRETLAEDGGRDPIDAAHNRLLPTTTLYSAYRQWRPDYDTHPRLTHFERARLLLDRVKQRDAILGAVTAMLDSHKTRVVAAFAYGDRGNLAEIFGDQARESLDRKLKEVRVLRSTVRVAGGATADADQLYQAFCRTLELDPGVQPDLRQTLRERAAAHSDRPPLWLFHWHLDDPRDWRPAERRAWEAFCRETLAASCPQELNILALLPIETGGSAQRGALTQQVNDLLDADPAREDYRLLELPPLSKVQRHEVRDFLVDAREDPWPAELLRDLPGLILSHASAGQSDKKAPFDKTTEVLERGLDLGWELLRDQLVAEQPSTR